MTWKKLTIDAQRALAQGQYISSTNSLLAAANSLRRHLIPRLSAKSDHLRVVHYTSIEVLFLILKAHIDRKQVQDRIDQIQAKPQPPNAQPQAPQQPDHSPPPPGYLRLYDSVHLSDPTEGRLVLDRVQERKYLNTSNSEEDDLGTHLLSLVEVNPRSPRKSSNDLMYWRAYGDDGRGCSITFTCPLRLLNKVTYSEVAAIRAAKEIDRVLLLAHLLSKELSKSSKKQTEARKQLRAGLSRLLDVRYYYKHGAYRLEREVRVTSADMRPHPVKPQFDYRRPYIRHYVEHSELSADRIFKTGTVITLGPSAREKHDLRKSIYQMLLDADLPSDPSVKVMLSNLPYRSI